MIDWLSGFSVLIDPFFFAINLSYKVNSLFLTFTIPLKDINKVRLTYAGLQASVIEAENGVMDFSY